MKVVGDRAGELHDKLDRMLSSPTFVLYTSGSTGTPKPIVHSWADLRVKIRPSIPKTMLFFMQLDHIGGVNTVLHAMANGHTLVTVKDRQPETILKAIEEHKVQVLPTTPTFLNLLILSGLLSGFDLSSLELITYGTEVMPESTLASIRRHIPHVRLKQTYGLTEIGIVPTKSKSDDSLWVKIGCKHQVVDGMLEIWHQGSWFKTKDAVETDGEWLKILGRQSDLIFVGGEKVYPAEVESFLQAIPGVMSASVSGEPHPLMGNYVTARVQLSTGETVNEFRKRMRKSWTTNSYKMPIVVTLAEGPMVTDRFKRDRHVPV